MPIMAEKMADLILIDQEQAYSRKKVLNRIDDGKWLNLRDPVALPKKPSRHLYKVQAKTTLDGVRPLPCPQSPIDITNRHVLSMYAQRKFPQPFSSPTWQDPFHLNRIYFRAQEACVCATMFRARIVGSKCWGQDGSRHVPRSPPNHVVFAWPISNNNYYDIGAKQCTSGHSS